MPRASQAITRASAVVCALAFLAQCAGSSSAAVAPDTTDAPIASAVDATVVTDASPVDTSIVDTTVPTTTTTTTVPRTTTTTIPESTSTTIPLPVIDPNCPVTSHGAVIDRARQRAWLCFNGVALPEFVVTTARDQPDPGTYPVFGKSMRTFSRFGGHYSTMTHFVAFTRGERTVARVGFHTVPKLKNGEYVQPLESVGTGERRGDSSGCIRVLPEQGQVVWDWLQIGDQVNVIN